MSLQTEQIVDGRYRVLGRIGSGGMADVYMAEDLQLGRNVALKVLHERFAADREFVERFRREASSAAGLQHPNVVGVYDRGEVDGTSYIAMEHVEGQTLKQLVLAEAPLEPARAIDLVVQVLRAARFAHRRGVVHRDLKPHNVMVDREGRAKVTDFGIARAGASDMTQTGSIMGTAQYLSPEQAQGRAVSARSDLYSIGIILFELLTGRVPFDGDSAVTVALKQVNEAPVPPSAFNPAVTPELDAAILRTLAKDPADRPADADELIAVLEAAASRLPVAGAESAVVAEAGVSPIPATGGWAVPDVAERRQRRSLWPWALVTAVAVAAIVLAVVLGVGGAQQVVVPNVVGAQAAVAEQALERRGFQVRTVSRQSDEAEGEVIGQDPPGGRRAEQGSTVRLTVSAGPGTTTVPAVEGLPRSRALALLREAGLEVEERRAPSADVGENRVIRAVPTPGSEVERGTTVTLTISSGPERTAVPDVTGRTRAEAASALEAAGFRVQVDEEETSSAEPGTVTGQNPGAGTRLAEGSTVTITVATEPEEVEVPDVTGEEAAAAVSALSGAGFRVRQTEREIPSPDGDGTVVEQSPGGGQTAERGSTVEIVVARFSPDLDPEGEGPETPPTETAPPDGTGGTAG